MSNGPRIIVALDFPEPGRALELVDQLDPARCRLKVGKELFTRGGPAVIDALVSRDYDVFLDMKFHDIPNTVARACAAAADLGVWMLNVHALGGRRMMEAARDAVDRGRHKPLLVGVTILTSLDEQDLSEIGLEGPVADHVGRLAALAGMSGLDGVVCSPREITLLREQQDDDFLLVIPGIRPAGAEPDDQKRVMAPGDAVRSGADYLVIGRPVTMADNPLRVLLTIESEIRSMC